MNKVKTIQPYLAVVEDLPQPPEQYNYPFKDGDVVVFLGEIEQMPGHAVVASKDGRVLWGYHTENFRKLTDEEA
jgi:hypothetical protein